MSLAQSEFFERKIKTLFTRFDFDSNGMIEIEDFKSWGAKLAHAGGLDEERAKALVQSLLKIWKVYFLPADTNFDGSVEFPELLEHMQSTLMGKQNDLSKSKAITDTLPLIFEAIDTNGDGSIESPEFATYFASFGIVDTQFADAVFRAMDANSDGSLSIEAIKSTKMPVEVTVNGKPVELKPMKVTQVKPGCPPPPEVAAALKEVSEILAKAAC